MKFINFVILMLSFLVTIQAQCVKGNCTNGKGKYIFSDNSKYEGQFKHGNMHGKGILTTSEGIFRGTFKRNKRDGEGKLVYNSGDTYIGQFKHNLFNGKGKFTHSNGDIYKGEWADGKKEGHGTYIFNNSDSYTGQFVNDRFNEEINETKVEEYDELSISQNLEHSEIINCNDQKCDNVIGRYSYSDGSVYEGMFINNQPQGEGICHYSNGSRYEGGWKNHSPHGIGVMTFDSGKKYGAEWSYGNPIRQITDNEVINPNKRKNNSNPKFDKEVVIYACIVGIAAYAHMPSLKYTDDDAYQIYAFLKSPEGGALKDENINLLIDDAATKNNIIYEMENIIAKADANDVIIVYLSGHGLQGSYIPSDFDGYNNNLPYSEILQLIDKSTAKHKICIADACHSGSMYASRELRFQGLESYYAKFEKLEGGTAFLTSSKSEEVSLEYSGLRHGVFSHFLIEGLKGSADRDQSGIVNLIELFTYVRNEVQTYTDYNQTPTLTGKYNPKMQLSNISYRKNTTNL